MNMLKSLQFLSSLPQRFLLSNSFFLRPQLAGLPSAPLVENDFGSALQDALWFAVPKQKVTRHKKRLKTTLQKRIPLRKDIVTDPRTGETTRMHRLPFNWKEYLPKKIE
jgi:ribosomal protein L32